MTRRTPPGIAASWPLHFSIAIWLLALLAVAAKWVRQGGALPWASLLMPALMVGLVLSLMYDRRSSLSPERARVLAFMSILGGALTLAARVRELDTVP